MIEEQEKDEEIEEPVDLEENYQTPSPPPSDSVSNIQICALDNIKGPLIAFFNIQRKIQTAAGEWEI